MPQMAPMWWTSIMMMTMLSMMMVMSMLFFNSKKPIKINTKVKTKKLGWKWY